MKVLALTHAHLNPEGLSPVSCERADSIVGAWGEGLKWDIDVIYTNGTKWRGIWPEGNGLKINIIRQTATNDLLMGPPGLFSKGLQALIEKKQFAGAASLFKNRITKRIRKVLSEKGFALPHEIMLAEKWGIILSQVNEIRNKQYDFIFVCVGHGDEYLLQTALTLSRKLHVPMVVDFRDLWSEHHVPGRFTGNQRKQIQRIERKLLVNAILISVPQKHMATLLRKWATAPVYLLPHSAYADKSWEEGHVNSGAFTMLYAGKLYPGGPGLGMLLELIKKLSQAQLYKPVKCHFFVDDVETLHKLAIANGVEGSISINRWVSPSELWKNMRSAHLLLIPDAGVAEDFPLLPTKTFQYAHTGRQILGLSPYKNPEMAEFLSHFNAGTLCTNVNDAVRWVTQLSFEKGQYELLPPLRKLAMREDVAMEYGAEIEKVLVHR